VFRLAVMRRRCYENSSWGFSDNLAKEADFFLDIIAK
jgi:hypothetical protein